MALTALITGASGGIGEAFARIFAQYGFDAPMRGKVVAVPGFWIKLMTGTAGFAPRFLVRRLVQRMQAKKQWAPAIFFNSAHAPANHCAAPAVLLKKTPCKKMEAAQRPRG